MQTDNLDEVASGPCVSDSVAAPLLQGSYVYFIQSEAGGPVKIGMAGNPYVRLRTLQLACPYELKLHAAVPGGRIVELAAHDELAPWRMHGEWFMSRQEVEDLRQIFVTARGSLVDQQLMCMDGGRRGDLARARDRQARVDAKERALALNRIPVHQRLRFCPKCKIELRAGLAFARHTKVCT